MNAQVEKVTSGEICGVLSALPTLTELRGGMGSLIIILFAYFLVTPTEMLRDLHRDYACRKY